MRSTLATPCRTLKEPLIGPLWNTRGTLHPKLGPLEEPFRAQGSGSRTLKKILSVPLRVAFKCSIEEII